MIRPGDERCIDASGKVKMANLGVTEASRDYFTPSDCADAYPQGSHSIRGTAMRRRTKIILAVIGVALVWPLAQIGLIAAQAQYYANGRPYCMDTSGRRFHYRPVSSLRSLLDLACRRLSSVPADRVHTASCSGRSTPCWPLTREAQR